MRVEEVFEIGEAGPVAAVGVGLATLAIPYFVPGLRGPAAELLKGSIRLFLDAELGADNALTDRLVDVSVDSLMRAISTSGADKKESVDREVHRFFSKARAASDRRGFDRKDADRRYHKHLSKFEQALRRMHPGASSATRNTLDHVVHRVRAERGHAAG
jgi:hypothetical protein